MEQFNQGVFYFKRAETNRESQDFEKAIELYTSSIRSFEDPGIMSKPAYLEKAYFGRGFCFNRLKRHEDAIADIMVSLKLNPDNAWGWALSADSCYSLGRYLAAIEQATNAIELVPEYSWAWAIRGYAYFLLNDFDQAILDVTQSIILDPTNASNWVMLGVLKGEKGKKENGFIPEGAAKQANECWDRAIKIDPESTKNYRDRLSQLVGKIPAYPAEQFAYFVNRVSPNSVQIENISKPKVCRTIKGNFARLKFVDFSNDGQFLLVEGGDNSKIKPCEIQNNGLYLVSGFIDHEDEVVSVRFSPDNQFALSSDSLGTIRLWNLKTIEQLYSYKGEKTEGGILSLGFTYDGTHIFWTNGGGIENPPIHLLNIRTKETSEFIPAHTSEFDFMSSKRAAFSPDNKHLIIMYNDMLSTGLDPKEIVTKIGIYDIQSGREVKQLVTERTNIDSFVVSSDGSQILTWAHYFHGSRTISDDDIEPDEWRCNLIHWNVRSGEKKQIVELGGSYRNSYDGYIDEVIKVPNSDFAVSAFCTSDSGSSYASLICLWNLTKKKVQLLSGLAEYKALKILPDGSKAVLVYDDEIVICELPIDKVI